MRGDYLFLISLLSIASVVMLYLGSQPSHTYIYGTVHSLKERIDKTVRDRMPDCCNEMKKECFACAAGILVKDFCSRHAGRYGCPTRKTPTVKIVTLHTKSNPWCKCAISNVATYSKLHNYDHIVVRKTNTKLNHVKFQKYYEVLAEMTTASIILLLDCDIAVTNMSIKIEDVYNRYKNDMVISRDALWNSGVPINSGAIMFRKSNWTLNLLKKMSYAKQLKGDKYLSNTLVDQPVLTDLLVRENLLQRYPKNQFEQSKHVTVVNQQVMNSFYRRGISFFKNDPEYSKWKPGNWMVHVTGSKGSERLKILQEIGVCGCQTRNMRRPETMQMNQKQIDQILSVLPTNGNLLVWGLGNDSPFWKQSTCGHVIFIEDNREWINKIALKYPLLDVEKVRYTTGVKKSLHYINGTNLSSLALNIPRIKNIDWDVIIVDAPAGNYDEAPGRYQSIYNSKQLVRPNKITHVFVDDYDRKVERKFSLKVFGNPTKIIKRPRKKNSEKNSQAYFKLSY